MDWVMLTATVINEGGFDTWEKVQKRAAHGGGVLFVYVGVGGRGFLQLIKDVDRGLFMYCD